MVQRLIHNLVNYLKVRAIRDLFGLSLVPILALFTISIAGAEDSSGVRYQKIEQYLNQNELIRVAVLEEHNFGHQAASASVVTRLRQLGYRGYIEVVYEKTTIYKLPKLFPPFAMDRFELSTALEEGRTYPIQDFPQDRIRFIDFDTIDAFRGKPVALGFVGGDDRKIQPESLGVQALIRVQPFRWYFPPSLTRRDTMLVPIFREYKNLGILRQIGDSNDVSELNFSTMDYDEELREKAAGLRTLLAGDRVFDLGTIYGHDMLAHSSKTAAYLLALKLAQAKEPELFRKKSVVFLFNQYSNSTISELKRNLHELSLSENQVSIAQIDEANLGERFDKMPDGSTFVVFVGPVAKPLFEALFSKSDLLAVVEGQNSINYLAMLGLPYLPTWPSRESYHFKIKNSETQKLLQKSENGLFKSINIYFAKDHAPAIADFILEAKRPNSLVRRVFAENQIQLKIENDKIALMIEESMIRSNLPGRLLHFCDDLLRTFGFPLYSIK